MPFYKSRYNSCKYDTILQNSKLSWVVHENLIHPSTNFVIQYQAAAAVYDPEYKWHMKIMKCTAVMLLRDCHIKNNKFFNVKM